ncbi:MAG TPA: hypothetical protein VLG36_03070 [Candidatus Chromulinivoraceae bacterium]|nr:hypothetical protein [Candidatus Chromulinivoraceae bacterium]
MSTSSSIGSQPKERIGRESLVQSKWITIYKDAVKSNDGRTLEYVTVDRSDSVIIIVVKEGQFILGGEQFRPGADEKTLDFVGGRVDSLEPTVAAEITLRRELSLDESVSIDIMLVTKSPLYVDSAFSNQKLHGYIVNLKSDVTLPSDAKSYTYEELLRDLRCLQCRAILLEARVQNLL